MGTKLHSLYVKCSDVADVADALREERDVDAMGVTLVPAGTWSVALAEEPDDLARAGASLSQRLAVPVVHTRMLDGDAVEMRLFVGGRERAWLAYPPNEWERKSVGRA